MKDYSEEWAQAVKKSDLYKHIERIVPVTDGLKVVYHLQIQENPPRYEEFPFIVNINHNPSEIVDKHEFNHVTYLKQHLEFASKALGFIGTDSTVTG